MGSQVTQSKLSFEALCKTNGLKTYSIEIEKKSAIGEFFPKKVPFLENLIHLRTNRFTNLAANKVTKKYVLRLVSIGA